MTRSAHLWRILHAPCRDVCHLASESLDRDLGLAERLALRSHLLTCTACRRFLQQIRLIRAVVARLGAPESAAEASDDPLPANVRERIKQRLRDG